MIRRILVALDGSARAPTVFDAAAEMAARFGAMLRPFRAIHVPPEFPAAAAGSRSDPLPSHLARCAEEELARITSRHSAHLVTVEDAIVRVGEPWRLIIEISDEIDADLIVVGSHGYHALDRILGTTAARVADIAHRSVLVVHERADRLLAMDGGLPYRQGAS